jgi:hypothetical protein
MRSDLPTPALPPGTLLVGWKEYLDFPEWNLRRVRVKIDTGARTSALDVTDCAIEDGPDGPMARLVLHLHRTHRMVEVTAPVCGSAVVRNTGGGSECRPVLDVLVRLGPVQKRIRLTVTNRTGLRHRMILGRQALAGGFVVDVSRKYLLRT